MVCQEEVFIWFRNLKGFKRIETMCGFLNMCYPLELRFYGTCLEDLGRRDFYAISEEETKANNITEILKICNIHDPVMRSKLIVVLSLLNSSNTLCAKELFNVLSEELKIEKLESLNILSDPNLLEQYLLLLSLAQHHPAFSFSQQNFLGNLSICLEKYASTVNTRTSFQCGEPAIFSSNISNGEQHCNTSQILYALPVHSKTSEHHQQLGGRITNLKVKSFHKRQHIRVQVTWDNSKVTYTCKTTKELLQFHYKLLELFPEVAKNENPEKIITPFPQSLVDVTLNDAMISAVSEYIQELNTKLPDYILENEWVKEFFMPLTCDQPVVKKSGQSNNLRYSSLTIYNSQMTEADHINCCRKILGKNSGRSSPVTSPLQSPCSSPYASPVSSETSSRPTSPWNHIEKRTQNRFGDFSVVDKEITDGWEDSQNYTIEELQAMPIEELQSLGILNDTKKIRKVLDWKSLPNIHLSKNPNGLLMQQLKSNNSSPLCSEYSSPSESPSPAEFCNALSSNAEENIGMSKILSDHHKSDDSDSSINVLESNFKKPDGDSLVKGNCNQTLSVFSLSSPYSSLISQIQPSNIKPGYIPVPCRTSTPQNINPCQFTRLPLSSIFTFLPRSSRSHTMVPADGLLACNVSTSMSSLPTVVTSGCSTVLSATSSITTQKSSNVTLVTNSAACNNRHTLTNTVKDDIKQPGDALYSSSFMPTCTAQLTPCSCFTTNSSRPSPVPSPSPQPSTVPVSLPYLAMPPYMFHHSIPFVQANSFVPSGGGQSFNYTLPSGISTVPPELVYPGQTFALQSPPGHGTPASHVSQCFTVFPPQTTGIPLKLITCYNCGKVGHQGTECKEQTIDDLNKAGKFQLNYVPIPKIPDSHD